MQPLPDDNFKDIVNIDIAVTIFGDRADAINALCMYIVTLPGIKLEFQPYLASNNFEELDLLCQRIKNSVLSRSMPRLKKMLEIFHDTVSSYPEEKNSWMNTYEDLVAAIDEVLDVFHTKQITDSIN